MRRNVKSLLCRFGFYLALWRQFIFSKFFSPSDDLERFAVPEAKIICSQSAEVGELPRKGIVWFWVPSDSAGASLILWAIIPRVADYFQKNAPNVEIVISDKLPSSVEVSLLFSFKAVPNESIRTRANQVVLVICDQAHLFWCDLRLFDAVVVTSSYELARLIANQTTKPVYFIDEPEKDIYFNSFDEKGFQRQFFERRSVLWHGGSYSLSALLKYQEAFEVLAKNTNFSRIILISGNGADLGLKWDGVEFSYIPWAPDALIEFGKTCRLAFLPARSSLRNSYLKPAARLRCCYAFGVPAIGDHRVPEVVRLSATLRAPLIPRRKQEVGNFLQSLWSDVPMLADLAKKGHEHLQRTHSEQRVILSWVRLINHLSRN